MDIIYAASAYATALVARDEAKAKTRVHAFIDVALESSALDDATIDGWLAADRRHYPLAVARLVELLPLPFTSSIPGMLFAAEHLPLRTVGVLGLRNEKFLTLDETLTILRTASGESGNAARGLVGAVAWCDGDRAVRVALLLRAVIAWRRGEAIPACDLAEAPAAKPDAEIDRRFADLSSRTKFKLLHSDGVQRPKRGRP